MRLCCKETSLLLDGRSTFDCSIVGRAMGILIAAVSFEVVEVLWQLKLTSATIVLNTIAIC